MSAEDHPSQYRRPCTKFESHQVSDFVPEWCDECRLPSILAATFVMTPVLNPTLTVWRGVYGVCMECGAKVQRPTPIA